MAIDALTSQSYDSLVNGVSRQPARARDTSQCEEQTNVVSDVRVGVKRRPPLEMLRNTEIPNVGGENVYSHFIDFGEEGQYIVNLHNQNNKVRVYDLNATGAFINPTIDTSAGSSSSNIPYFNNLVGVSAREAYRATTVGFDTYIVNKKTTPAMSGVTADTRENAHEFLLFGKSGATSGHTNTISLTIGDTTVEGEATETISSESMINALMTALCGDAALSATDVTGTGGGDINDWRFTRISTNVVYAYQFQNTPVPVNADDSFGSTIHELCVTGVNGEVPVIRKFSDLGFEGRDGFVIEVQGDVESNDDSFYVKYVEDERKWEESRDDGLDNAFDPETMPLVLTFDPDTTTFTLSAPAWKDRNVGDVESAPEPSFIGQPINDVLVHENRLLFATGENVVASEVGDYTNFFPTTVTTLVDSDPLDVAGASDRSGAWDYMLPQKSGVFLFSSVGNQIGRLRGGRDKILTIENARIEVVGYYDQTDILRPVAQREQIYFVQDKGGHSSVIEFSERDIELFTQDEITAHIGDYLPPDLVFMTSSPAEEFLLFSTRSEPSTIYVYRTHHLGVERVMSSWSKWEIPGHLSVLNMGFIGSTLYMTTNDQSDDIVISYMDFSKTDEDGGAGNTPLGHRVHLDLLERTGGSYVASLHVTVFNVGVALVAPFDDYVVYLGGDWGEDRGRTITLDLDYTSGTAVAVSGDWSAHDVYIGRKYKSTYALSEVSVRTGSSRNATTYTGAGKITGRLQLRRGHFVYDDSSAFDVVVSSVDDDEEYTYNYVPISVGLSAPGYVPPASGTFEFDIGAHSESARIRIESDYVGPFEVNGFAWEGRYYNRTRS